MHTFKKLFLLGLVIATPLTGNTSEQSNKKQMTTNLDFIHQVFQIQYAPSEWKLSYANWDLETEFEKATEAIENTPNITPAEYRKILNAFFNSTKDYHVKLHYDSTEKATLPFSVTGVDGRYFIMDIDNDSLPASIYAINKGDELVFFGDRPVHECILELKTAYTKLSNEKTDFAIAEKLLTERKASSGVEVPKGPILLTFKSRLSDKLYSYQMIWDYTPETIQNYFGIKPIEEELTLSNDPLKNLKNLIKNPNMLLPECRSFERNFKTNNPTPNDIGYRNSFIPTLGTIWWTSEANNWFDAYLYETPEGKKIGYLRIANYMGDEEQIEDYMHIINFFEERTDAMVIDQLNNPGGSLFYLYTLTSMLSEQPLYTPKHRVALSSNFVATAVAVRDEIDSLLKSNQEIEETLNGIPLSKQTLQFMYEFYQFIIEEWNAGKTITSPTCLMGVDAINPHPFVRYTKPILLLINHLDFSGGDFFPAILQDNKRVLTLGTTTAGAGGVVSSTSFPNRMGISRFSYTFSIAERLDGQVLENLGVTPDIEYNLTEEDLLFGYSGYVEAIHQAVKMLTEEVEESETNDYNVDDVLKLLEEHILM